MVPWPTVNSGWQERGDDFSLSFLVFVQKALEAVENSTAQHEGLPLVHHGHQQHYYGRPVGQEGKAENCTENENSCRYLIWIYFMDKESYCGLPLHLILFQTRVLKPKVLKAFQLLIHKTRD